MANRQSIGALLALSVALAGCHSASGPQSSATGRADGGTAQAAADSITRAAYNDDYNGVTANMDGSVRSKVARGKVGTMSDQMHKLGEYRGVSLLSGDAAKNEFTYRAQFSKSSANVVVRLDPDGKVAAYHAYIPVTK